MVKYSDYIFFIYLFLFISDKDGKICIKSPQISQLIWHNFDLSSVCFTQKKIRDLAIWLTDRTLFGYFAVSNAERNIITSFSDHRRFDYCRAKWGLLEREGELHHQLLLPPHVPPPGRVSPFSFACDAAGISCVAAKWFLPSFLPYFLPTATHFSDWVATIVQLKLWNKVPEGFGPSW